MTPRPVAPAADVHAVLAAPMRRRLLAHLESTGSSLDAHELAAEVGLHPSTVRFHLETLRSAGLVERTAVSGVSRPDTVGRPRTGYAVTRPGRSEPDYEELARRLAAGLGDTPDVRDARAEGVGAAWGRELAATATPDETPVLADAAVRRTVQMLDELGFRPGELQDPGPGIRIALHGCPFREVARDNPEVCALHRGLLTASLASMGSPLTGRLRPFVEPELCVVDLETAG
ncbi:MAG: helix-turn-helix domain-containing protein [Ornithinibacter sp.]